LKSDELLVLWDHGKKIIFHKYHIDKRKSGDGRNPTNNEADYEMSNKILDEGSRRKVLNKS